MSDQVAAELFRKELFDCLDETFEQHHGIYLDKGTSLFETLEGVSAVDASRPVAEGCAPIAAHVEHVRFYLDVLDEVMQKEVVIKVDWREIWRDVRGVTPEEWEEMKLRLRASYQRVLTTLKNYERWEGEYGVSGFLRCWLTRLTTWARSGRRCARYRRLRASVNSRRVLNQPASQTPLRCEGFLPASLPSCDPGKPFWVIINRSNYPRIGRSGTRRSWLSAAGEGAA